MKTKTEILFSTKSSLYAYFILQKVFTFSLPHNFLNQQKINHCSKKDKPWRLFTFLKLLFQWLIIPPLTYFLREEILGFLTNWSFEIVYSCPVGKKI